VETPKTRLAAVSSGAAIVLLTLIAYLPATQAGFIWDDDRYVEKNLTLRGPEGLAQIWLQPAATPQYYPLVHSSYWLEYRIWGLNPTGYHVVNILLHCLACVLVWRVLLKLDLPPPTAWAAAAVFALHPVHVESVAWITERKNVLSIVFYLAALSAFLNWAPSEGRRRGGLCGVALLLFVCALLSKTVTASLPFVLLLLIWWKRGRVTARDFVAVGPFLALGIFFGLLTVWLEKYHVGAIGEEWNLSLMERLLVSGRALWFYASKLAWPAGQSFIYPRWTIDSFVWWQPLFPVAAIACISGLWLTRHRIGRGPLVAVLFFAGTLVPALGFFDVYPFRYSFVADHFQYLASLGLIVLAIEAGRRALGSGVSPVVGPLVLVILLSALGGMTWNRTLVFHDRETLWRSTLKQNPNAWIAHNNLGEVLLARGRVDESLHHLLRYLDLVEDAPVDKAELAQAHNNIGLGLTEQGNLNDARREFRKALEIEPGYPYANNNMGVVLQTYGQLEGAILHFQRALEGEPGYARAHFNLGSALIERGDREEGLRHLEVALRLDPDDPQIPGVLEKARAGR
jgi:tetratricopeptide (TPR) repeat protein